MYASKAYEANNTVDNVGTGDCCMAGIIKGMYEKRAPQNIIDFAAAAAFQKAFSKGDFTTSSLEKINSLIIQHEQATDF